MRMQIKEAFGRTVILFLDRWKNRWPASLVILLILCVSCDVASKEDERLLQVEVPGYRIRPVSHNQRHEGILIRLELPPSVSSGQQNGLLFNCATLVLRGTNGQQFMIWIPLDTATQTNFVKQLNEGIRYVFPKDYLDWMSENGQSR
jgi:hypothetical protein